MTGPENKNDINLIDYMFFLIRHKKTVILITVVPTILAFLIIFLLPDKYQLTYCYNQGRDKSSYQSDEEYIKDDRYFDLVKYFSNRKENDQHLLSEWNLTQKNYQIFQSWFYSNSNMHQITDLLKENGLNEYAQKIEIASKQGQQAIRKLINFRVYPPFPNLSSIKTTDHKKINGLRKIEAELLWMEILGDNKGSIYKSASVIRHNFENIIPICIFEQFMRANTRTLNMKIMEIKENIFELNTMLDAEKELLKKLKRFTDSDITEEQILRTEFKIIDFEKNINVEDQKLKYNQELLDLNQKLSDKLNAKLFSKYTIQDFKNEINEMLDLDERKNIKNHLLYMTEKIDNRILLNTPVTENPEVTEVSKSIVKKTAAIFFISLMFSFLFVSVGEHLKYNKLQN